MGPRIWLFRNFRAVGSLNLLGGEWYLNGEMWLSRDEKWDSAKYGEQGVMADVSIYDFDAGLPFGVYQFSIFIDGVLQPIGKTTEYGTNTFIEFEILPPIEAKSPNGDWTATANLGKLFLMNCSFAKRLHRTLKNEPKYDIS